MDPQTEKNLEHAMAVEAFSHARYTRFAACARMNENSELARLFQTAADEDRMAHFRREFDFIHPPCNDAENLEAAIKDKAAAILMYSEFIRQAKAVRDNSAAALFDAVRQDEMAQMENFKAAIKKIHPPSSRADALGA